MTENTQEARLQLARNVSRRVLERLEKWELSEADFLPHLSRATIEEVRGKEFVSLRRGGYIQTETIDVDIVEVPRDTIGLAMFCDHKEIPDEDELVDQVEENLAGKFIERYDAVKAVLGKEPKMFVFGNIRTKEFIEADVMIGSYETIPGNWHFIANLDIGIAGVK